MDKTLDKQKETVQKTVDFFYETEKLLIDFHKLRGVSFCTKFQYPFRHLIPSVVCVSYIFLQVAFLICAAVTYDEEGKLMGHILNGGEWALYYNITFAIIAVANSFTLLVTTFWIIIGIIIIAYGIIIIVIGTYVIANGIILLIVVGCICVSYHLRTYWETGSADCFY